MSLVIVVGGLEPMRDGIGDHSRRLAAALIKRGIPTVLLGLADQALDDDARRGRQSDDGVEVETLRLATRVAFKDRAVRGRKFIEEVGGRHAMFAFSPYQFDLRGVVSRALVELPEMVRGLTTSMLFHETWIGEEETDGLWTRLVGFTQRRLVQMLAHDLKPVKLYSTNPVYRQMLAAYDIKTQVVPHCGNVPVQETRADSWLPQAMADAGVEMGPAGLRDFYLIGLFGSLYGGLELPRLLPSFEAVARRKGKKPLIANIGIIGNGGQWARWKKIHGARFGIVDLGPTTTLRISQFLNTVDLGVSTTTLALAGKSGTAAAFTEHGVPLLLPIEYPHFRHWRESMMAEYPPNYMRVTPDLVDRLSEAKRRPPSPLLPPLADRLAADLSPYVN